MYNNISWIVALELIYKLVNVWLLTYKSRNILRIGRSVNESKMNGILKLPEESLQNEMTSKILTEN